jgi:putative ABC transport system permease protein
VRLGEAWRIAVTALRANRLRSLLTMLGVIIGVAAVVMLVAIGTGAKQYVEGQVEGLGSNLLLVVPGEITFGSSPTSSRLTLADVDDIGRIAGDPQRVAATVTSGETLRAGEQEVFATVQGVTETVPEVFVRPVARGEFLSRSDVDTAAGSRCSARPRRTSCSPARTRSAASSPSPACGSGWWA